MSKPVIGKPYTATGKALALGARGFDSPVKESRLVSFRLVYDNSERSCRGADRSDTPLLAKDPGLYWYRPGLRGVGAV